MLCALVVDDDDAIRNLTATLLKREAFEVDTARDGCEALDRLRRHHYDVVLLDLMMPNVCGDEVIDMLEAEAPTVAERVVVMTAWTKAPAMLTGKHPCKVLIKPFDINELLAAVRSCAGSADRHEWHGEQAAVSA